MSTTRNLESGDHEDWLRLFTGYLHFNEATLPSELAELTFDRLIDPSVDLHGAIAWDGEKVAVGLVQWTTQLSRAAGCATATSTVCSSAPAYADQAQGPP